MPVQKGNDVGCRFLRHCTRYDTKRWEWSKGGVDLKGTCTWYLANCQRQRFQLPKSMKNYHSVPCVRVNITVYIHHGNQRPAKGIDQLGDMLILTIFRTQCINEIRDSSLSFCHWVLGRRGSILQLFLFKLLTTDIHSRACCPPCMISSISFFFFSLVLSNGLK